MTTRTPLEDIVINGVYFPKGSTVYIDFYGIQRDPQHWPEPEVFRPERFLDKVSAWTHAGMKLEPLFSGSTMQLGLPAVVCICICCVSTVGPLQTNTAQAMYVLSSATAVLCPCMLDPDMQLLAVPHAVTGGCGAKSAGLASIWRWPTALHWV